MVTPDRLTTLCLVGEFIHICGMLILLGYIFKRRSCEGISAKTQILYLMVHLTKYVNLSKYTMDGELKLTSFIISLLLCILILGSYKTTYQRLSDAVITELVVFVGFISAVTNNYEMTAPGIMWSFSEYIEEVVLVPQFVLCIIQKKIHTHVIIYLASTFIYKALYCINIIYVYMTLNEDPNIISTVTGTLFIIIFIVYSLIMYCKGVKIDNGEQHFLSRNIRLNTVSVITPSETEKEVLIVEKY